MLEITNLPTSISMFPGLTDRIYFQNPETKEFWFHATSVCKTLGFSNVTSAVALHCEDDEKLQEIWNGKATWFVSEAGCYGLAMGAKNEVAKKFKRWLKHDVLPKLRQTGIFVDESRFDKNEINKLNAIIKDRDSRLALASEKIEMLETARRNEILNKARLLVCGADNWTKARAYEIEQTYKSLLKELNRMGFIGYTTEHLQVAMEFFRGNTLVDTGNIKEYRKKNDYDSTREFLNSKVYLCFFWNKNYEENYINFLGAIYDSMREDSCFTSTHVTRNMRHFEKVFGYVPKHGLKLVTEGTKIYEPV